MKHTWIPIGVTLTLATLLTACHSKKTPTERAALPPAQVRLGTVVESKRSLQEEVVGTVHSRLRAVIEAKVSGRIQQMPVVEGQRVQKGDLLVELDAKEIEARWEQASALAEQAGREHKRYQGLFAQQAATQQELDAVASRQRGAQASVDEAKTLRDYTVIRAPFHGVVMRKTVDLGDTASPGKALLELEDLEQLRLEVDVPEALSQRIKPGDIVQTRFAFQPDAVPGKVAEIAPSADAKSRTTRVKLDLPTAAGLAPGQFGRALISAGQYQVLSIPASAWVRRGQMEMVFVDEGNTAHLRLVKTGKVTGGEVEILSGLRSGERIVVEGAESLLDGQPLQAK
jgi:RND family efflux transporter MFP subunit